MDELTPASVASIGQRLRVAREAAGLSARAVSAALATHGRITSHTTICSYETGASTPEISDINCLAELYGRSPAWFLTNGPLLTGARYRALKSVRTRDRRAFEGEAAGWFNAYFQAENILGDFLTPEELGPDAHESGRAAAEKVRRVYKFGDYPIPSICRLAENFGIRVIQLDSPARIDGIAASFGTNNVVTVNPAQCSDRTRMSVAHELGHHILNHCGKAARHDEKAAEREAMEFASHLLIPDSQLKAAFADSSMVRLVQYKERFGVSLAAMIFRAHGCGIISNKTYKNLWIEFSRLGWRQDEPGYVGSDRPFRMEILFDIAIRGGKLTASQIALLAGVPERRVLQRIALAMGTRPMHSPAAAAPGNYKFDEFIPKRQPDIYGDQNA